MGEENARIYNVLIIGAGKIGAFFDQPGSENILTHAHAFSTHPGFKLLGFVDSNAGQAQKAVSIWGGEYFNNLMRPYINIELMWYVWRYPMNTTIRICRNWPIAILK